MGGGAPYPQVGDAGLSVPGDDREPASDGVAAGAGPDRVLVAAEGLWDLFATDLAGGFGYDARPGGSGLNAALALARLGRPVDLLTGVSDDRLGKRLVDRITAAGIGTDRLVPVRAPSTLSLIDVDHDGEPAFAIYGTGGADRQVSEVDLPPADAFGAHYGALHLGSFALVVPQVGRALGELCARAGGRCMVSLDPNVRSGVEPDMSWWRTVIEEQLPRVDVIRASAADLRLLFPDLAPSEVAARWLAAGPALAVVTHGAAGAEAWGGFGHVEARSAAVTVVDTVAAGDSFAGALIDGLMRAGGRPALDRLDGGTVRSVLARAVRAGGLCCARRGADPATLAELDEPPGVA